MSNHNIKTIAEAVTIVRDFLISPEFTLYIDQHMLEVKDASRILKVKEDTLNKWRMRGEGPSYSKLTPGTRGAIRYPLFGENGLLDFMNRTMQGSTSENF